jgi:hypothetical protein
MGSWGASLYEDDMACDLKTAISAVCKVPADGIGLLGFLKAMYGHCDPADEDAALFWLVVADQFERRGIECREAASSALNIIESGSALRNAHDREADAAFIRKRTQSLQELASRLRNPRPYRSRRRPGKPPPLVLAEGEVYAFPTMRGRAWHPYRLESEGPFEPDGWGALVVLATGRAFEWLPWLALASLTVKHDSMPTFEEALRARLIPHLQTQGAGRFIPKRVHAQGLGLQRLGHVNLDPVRVAPQLSRWSVMRAIQFDWSIAYAAISPLAKGAPIGVKLKSLIQQDG